MATEMVMAYGDHGMERVPAEDAVEIPTFPLAPGNLGIPATIRWMRQRDGGHTPTRLLAVHRPFTKRNPRPYAFVRFECTPYSRWEGDPSPSTECSCYVRGEEDARDPLFAGLSQRERARIITAANTGAAGRSAA